MHFSPPVLVKMRCFSGHYIYSGKCVDRLSHTIYIYDYFVFDVDWANVHSGDTTSFLLIQTVGQLTDHEYACLHYV